MRAVQYLCIRNMLVAVGNLLECMFLVTAGYKVNYIGGEFAKFNKGTTGM